MSAASALRRWFKSTSNRTFIAWPIALYAAEYALHRGAPPLHLWALALLAWGYLQYRWGGAYRTRLGGGGPGISIPPERLVTSGIYRCTRNPMYTGHIIYFTGVALLLASWIAAAVLLAHLFWFDRRVKEDEERLIALFGEPYREYCRRVKRWIPGVL